MRYPQEYLEFCEHVGLHPETTSDIAFTIVGMAQSRGLVGKTEEEVRKAYEHALRIILLSHVPENELTKMLG